MVILCAVKFSSSSGSFATSWTVALQAGILEWVAIFYFRRPNSGLLHCRQILYCLSYTGSPKKFCGF